jgi:hypothetical protein
LKLQFDIEGATTTARKISQQQENQEGRNPLHRGSPKKNHTADRESFLASMHDCSDHEWLVHIAWGDAFESSAWIVRLPVSPLPCVLATDTMPTISLLMPKISSDY